MKFAWKCIRTYELQVTKDMGQVVKGLDKAMAAMDLNKVCYQMRKQNVFTPFQPINLYD